MKTKYFLLFHLLSVLFPVAASAQGTVGDLESSFGARFSVEADKKLAKGVHAIVSGEARMTDGIGSPDRYQAGLELTYKFNDTFKFGVGYLLIEKMNSSGEWNPRHRFYADGKVSFRSGDWLFSVKERLQLTHREVGNVFQNTPNSLSFEKPFQGIVQRVRFRYAVRLYRSAQCIQRSVLYSDLEHSLAVVLGLRFRRILGRLFQPDTGLPGCGMEDVPEPYAGFLPADRL